MALCEAERPRRRPYSSWHKYAPPRAPPASTPRPVLDVDTACDQEMINRRAAAISPYTNASYNAYRVISEFRYLQTVLIQNCRRCNQVKALELAEDPSPYTREYIFYCLT